MNPPFSASPHVEGRFAEAAMRHIALGARAACRGRTPRRDHRPQCRSRSARLARGLHPLAGKGPRRLHGDDRRPGLCPPRHDDGDAAHGHRPRSGRRPARLSVLARNGRRRRRAARPGLPSGAAARAGDRSLSPARTSRPSGPDDRATAEAFRAATESRQTPGAGPRTSSSSPTRPASGRRAQPHA